MPDANPSAEADLRTTSAAAPWVRWLPWLAGAVAIMSVLGVFALPWLVLQRVQYVVSDSQMLGFSNRIAVAALALGALAMAALGVAWRTGSRGAFAQVLPGLLGEREATGEGQERSEQIDRRLVVALMVALTALLGLVAFAYGRYPASDSAYFSDRLLELVNGGRLYVDFEYAYGPLLIYPAYALWLALHGLGLDIFHAYYLSSLAGHALGIATAVYLLNRMRLPRSWKHCLLLLVFALDFLIANLGLNYSPIRFLAPFALLVWAVGLARRGAIGGVLGAVGAAVVAFGVSPEMGVVASFAIAITCAMLALRSRPLLWLGAAGAGIVGAAGMLANMRLAGSMFAVSGAGAAQLPVLPGQPALVFVGTMLVLGLAVGLTSSAARWDETSLQTGWFAGTLVLIVVGFGRADFGHLFWNCLPAVLLATACLWQVGSKSAVAYVSVVFAAFVVVTLSFVPVSLTALWKSAVTSGAIDKRRSVSIARHLGRSVKTGEDWYAGFHVPEPTDSDIDALAKSGGVIAPYFLQGKVGERLAENHALVPTFAVPLFIYSPDNMAALQRNLESARWVLLPRTEYDVYVKLATSPSATATPDALLAKQGSNMLQYAELTQFPLSAHAVNLKYDPALAVALLLRRGWELDRKSGGYVILRRRG